MKEKRPCVYVWNSLKTPWVDSCAVDESELPSPILEC